MALSRAKKAELIDAYTKALKGAKSAVYVKFKGLSVNDTNTLRGQLFDEGTHFTVVKKTLWSRAVATTGIKGDAPETPAEMAVVWGEDLLIPARIAYEFSRAHKESFGILGGVFDGSFKSQAEMLSIATIPPREVLLSQLAYLLKSPITSLAIGLSEVAKTKTQ